MCIGVDIVIAELLCCWSSIGSEFMNGFFKPSVHNDEVMCQGKFSKKLAIVLLSCSMVDASFL